MGAGLLKHWESTAAKAVFSAEGLHATLSHHFHPLGCHIVSSTSRPSSHLCCVCVCVPTWPVSSFPISLAVYICHPPPFLLLLPSLLAHSLALIPAIRRLQMGLKINTLCVCTYVCLRQRMKMGEQLRDELLKSLSYTTFMVCSICHLILVALHVHLFLFAVYFTSHYEHASSWVHELTSSNFGISGDFVTFHCGNVTSNKCVNTDRSLMFKEQSFKLLIFLSSSQ